MFKVVTEFVESPIFWMVCDNRACSCSASMPADMSSPQAMMKSQAEFIAAAVKDGWNVSLDGQICPPHITALKAAAEKRAEEGKKIIQPVGLYDDLKLQLVKH